MGLVGKGGLRWVYHITISTMSSTRIGFEAGHMTLVRKTLIFFNASMCDSDL